MTKSEKGFGIIEVVLALAVVGLIILIGWTVFIRGDKNTDGETANNAKSTKQAEDSPKSQAPSAEYTDLKLASDSVLFEVPKSWIVEEVGVAAPPTSSDIKNIESATLTPPEKKPTIYGSGKEYFKVAIGVYENKDNVAAKKWFQDIYSAGYAVGSDKTSDESINGYDTFYFRQINDSYDQLNYTYSASGKAVVVTARVFEKGLDGDRNETQADFSEYLPAIDKLAKSIKIE